MNKTTEIDVRFGHLLYTFYSKEDISKARSIYAGCGGGSDMFEQALDAAGIDYCYSITECL